MNRLKIIRPPAALHRTRILVLFTGLLLLLSVPSMAQTDAEPDASAKPNTEVTKLRFRKWNVGAGFAAGSANALHFYPSLAVHYRRWSLDLLPYVFNPGLIVTHHSPLIKWKRPVQFTLDASAFTSRENGNYYLTFIGRSLLSDEFRAGLTVGLSIYAKQRWAVQFMMGAQYIREVGPEDTYLSANPYRYLNPAGSFAVHFRLFKQFESQ